MRIAREETATAYLTEALLLLMERKPFAEISVTELCTKAGVTRVSFYRNFASKEDILAKHVRRITDEWLVESGISYSENELPDYFLVLLTHMDEHRALCEALNRAGLMHLIQAEFNRVFQAVHAGEYDPYKSAFHAGGVFNVYLTWLEGGCRETPAELSARLATILER